ncbi:TonB-dependent receptor [Ideonella sp.]|uniref:TonB-dependent receptor plug domain-containing protein n=1 Tax=Ideonella sp. TaxID=1929293 RepID=UPI002B47A875|nr:TonB-dependent receptor [Ideonella sp.]HJV71911.1 TonB-dependent receptor [Ideonella sp.]
MQLYQFTVLGLAAMLALSPRAAELSEEEELAMAFGDKSFVSIATGSKVPVARAASVATVITAEDIRAMGAADLDEVLETVPGLHVSRSPVLNAPIYTFRGVRGTLTNPQVLMLVNGIPQTRIYAGDRGLNWGGLPLWNVARIEVIRGPGSALYGADAYSGVISIQTKGAAEIDGTEFGARAGSFDTAGAWWLHGGRWGDVEVAGYLSLSRTDGGGRTISADAQTGLDAIFGAFGVPPVSLAPAPMNNGYKLIDAALDLTLDRWRFRTSYKRVFDLESGAGVAQALDPTGRNTGQRIDADLSWHDAALAADWDVLLRAYVSRYDESSRLTLFPAGTNLGGGFFQDGMIGAPAKWEHQARAEATAVYTGVEGHRVRLGAGYTNQDMYRLHEAKNFNPDFSPIGSGSWGDVTDVTDTVPFMRPHQRNVVHAYLQDEWAIAKDWALTAGVRHDRYSDFGATTHPRVALVWEAAYDITAKLLYGTAFRAPAFSELYLINNPTAIGNPSLSPEKMRTLEAAWSWQAAPNARLGLNLFRYQLTGLIRLDSSLVYQNQGEQTGRGVELEAEWEPNRQLRFAGHYAIQHSTDARTDRDPGLAPRQRAYLRADWQPLRSWQANAQVNWVADRKRQSGDSRPEIADYTTVDLTLRTRTGDGAWDLALSARNLFDADAREPAPYGVPYVSIPNDLPLPGRAIYVTLAYRL